jgi:plastocyanin
MTKENEMKPRFPVILCLLASLALASGCGTSGSKLAVTEVTARPNAAGVQTATIEVHSYFFKPSRVVVKAGTPVELILKGKNYLVPHNFTCVYPEAGIQVNQGVKLHKTKRIRFTPTTPGEYEFFCHVGSHSKKGMRGTLVVQ